MFKFLRFFFLGFCLFAIGCSSQQHQSLRKVDVGMDKADVLEVVGNPTRTERIHNQDRWTYTDFAKDDSANQSGHKITYIYFADGKVTYVGPDDDYGSITKSQGNFRKISDPEPAEGK